MQCEPTGMPPVNDGEICDGVGGLNEGEIEADGEKTKRQRKSQ